MALTKSQFVTYMDCPMHLWAQENDLFEDKERNIYLEHLSRQGYIVEDLAEEFLKQKLEKEYPVGSIIKFQHNLNDGNYEAILDAVITDTQNNTVDIYEIKSSSSVKLKHKYEVTFQHLLATTQLPVHKTYLIHVNSDYVRQGEVDLEKLFVVEDMTDTILKFQDEVERERAKAKQLLFETKPPTEDVCDSPKTCPCPSLCHTDLPNYSIYDIPDMRKKSIQFQTLKTMGIKDPLFIPSDFLLTTYQERYLESLRKRQAVINKQRIREILDELVFPLYFVDYETFGPAIPQFDGYQPYQNIVFQYSLHVVHDQKAKEIEHFEYLHTDKTEPSKQFVKDLLSHIGETGSIISWYKPFENSRNKELAELVPEYKERLLDLNERTYDLMEIFKNQHYVDYRFRGSSSIKSVLPVLIPHLSYKKLNIQKGDVAMLEWYNLINEYTGEERKQTIEDLLEYCKLDTYAMVEIWRVLEKL